MIVVNKKDLLSDEQMAEVIELAHERFPEKQLVVQSALLEDGTADWLQMIASSDFVLPKPESNIDYDRYDKGGRALAWLDESITLRSADTDRAVRLFVTHLFEAIKADEIAIGHVKFFFKAGAKEMKLSFPNFGRSRLAGKFTSGVGGYR